jgi:hypothetical protein
MTEPDVMIGVGGAAGDGVASAGNTLALSVARQALGVYAYNSHQSVIRGGHSWLRLRVLAHKPPNHGDQADALIAVNQDALCTAICRSWSLAAPHCTTARSYVPIMRRPPACSSARCWSTTLGRDRVADDV